MFSATREHAPTVVRFVVLLAIGYFSNTSSMYIVTEILAQSHLWGRVGSAAIVPATNFTIRYPWVFI